MDSKPVTYPLTYSAPNEVAWIHSQMPSYCGYSVPSSQYPNYSVYPTVGGRNSGVGTPDVDSKPVTHPLTYSTPSEMAWIHSQMPSYCGYSLPNSQYPNYSLYQTLGGRNSTAGAPVNGYKKKRVLFAKHQLDILKQRFTACNTIRQEERERLALNLGLTPEQIKIWFQNQRYKRRQREKKEQIISVTNSSTLSSSPSESETTDNGRNEYQKENIPLATQNLQLPMASSCAQLNISTTNISSFPNYWNY